MNVLLLSGSGWVGSRIAREFLENGFDVTVAARGLQKSGIFREVRFVHCDRTDPDEVTEVLRTHAKDIVVDATAGHFDEADTVRIAETLKGRVRRYLHCGSTGVYTPMKKLPGDESSPLTLPEEFGPGWIGKARADRIIQEKMKEGFPATILQPSCIMGAGAWPMDNLGSRDHDFFKRILEGTPLVLPDGGNMLIQFIHPGDIASAFRLAAASPQAEGGTYILSGERAVTVKTYIEMLGELLGRAPVFTYASGQELLKDYIGKPGEGGFRFFLEHMCFDISKAEKDFGWRPRHSLEDILAEVTEWVLTQYESGAF